MKTDFERYYLPIVLGFVVASGVAVGFLADAIWNVIDRRRTLARREASR
jgi:hypothetical protein